MNESETVNVVVVLKLRNDDDLNRRLSPQSELGGTMPFGPVKLNEYLPSSVQANAVAKYLAVAGFSNVRVPTIGFWSVQTGVHPRS